MQMYMEKGRKRERERERERGGGRSACTRLSTRIHTCVRVGAALERAASTDSAISVALKSGDGDKGLPLAPQLGAIKNARARASGHFRE